MSDPSLPACHVHAPRTSAGGCASCGTWLCAGCLADGVCPVCGLALESADSEEDPLERPAGVSEITMLFGPATDRTWQAFKGSWGILTIAVLLQMAVGVALGLFAMRLLPAGWAIEEGSSWLQTVSRPRTAAIAWGFATAQLALQADLLLIGDRALRGGRRIGLFLLDPWRRLPSLALLAPLVLAPDWAFQAANDLLHAGSLVGAGVAGALAASLWVVLVPVSMFATLELLLGRASLRVSLIRSWRMGRGRRWALALAILLGVLLAWVSALLPLVGLLAIVLAPVLWTLFQVALYHLARERTELPPLGGPRREVSGEGPPPALA